MTETIIVTRETVMAGRLRDAGHVNYGKLGGGTIWQHTTIPRLSAVDRPLDPAEAAKVGARAVREWSVDGGRAGSLDDAVAALNVPPVLTDQERIVLDRVPDEWTELHGFRTALGEEMGEPIGLVLMMLRHKGAIENELRPSERRQVSWIRRAAGSRS